MGGETLQCPRDTTFHDSITVPEKIELEKTLRLLLSHCIKLSANVWAHYLLKYDYRHNATGESDILDNILSLLILLTAGELHPGECALWDGGNEENCGTHPDSCHAGDGNQPPQPISRADPQTDRR